MMFHVLDNSFMMRKKPWCDKREEAGKEEDAKEVS